MNRAFIAFLSLFLVADAPSVPAQTFVAPKPQVAPRAATPGSSSARRQPRATAPSSLCEQMTREWVDHRPMLDFPALEGRISLQQQQSALGECEAEQRRRPADVRVAFIFARTLEVNNRGSRAAGLFRQLADAGYAPAKTQLARALQFGSGLAKDMVASCELYVDAAKAGDVWAYNPAANCLSFQDFTHDPRLACFFFQKAQSSDTFQSDNLSRTDYCPE
jgi:TPR repeat protein